MGKIRENSKFYSQMVTGVTVLLALPFSAGTVQAVSVLNSCTTYCHSAPPRDAARKGNPHFGSQSSAFLGTHRNHLPTAADFASCSVCHTPVAASDFGHQNNVIRMSNSLKGYSSATLRAKYDKGVFFNQTSIPNLTNATCSNVNCHFEKKTPVWGSAAYNVTTDCNACHGAPPAGTSAAPAGGLAGSHSRHDVYFPGTANCQKCHPNSAGFIHATSAGRALKVQGYLRNPLNALEAAGTYSGTGANYLPSKSSSQVFGTCNNIYCHSSGQSGTGTATGISYKTVVWGSSALVCASCHVDEATDATGTGSHRVHTISTGANYDCAACHLGYTKTTVSTATHVNDLIELGAAGFTYSQGSGAPHPVANGYGTCSVSTCHGSGTVTWGATFTTGTTFPYSASQCDKCHSGTATAPFYSTAAPSKVTANTDAKVGAHTSHLTTPDGLATAFVCADCHGTVALNTATHMNGTTNFVWSTLATKGGTLTPTYTAATRTCANVYCHGASMPGGDTTGTNRAPVWNSTTYLPATISAAACGTCHGFPPSSASGHPSGITIPANFGNGTVAIGTTCSCHSNISTTGTTYANIFVNKALHINGIFEPAASGHVFPYSGSLHLSAAGVTPWSSCTSCHTNTAGGTYPVAAGTAPNCTGCHSGGLKVPSGTSSCWDCHGASATDGLPNGTVFPNTNRSHSAHVSIAGTACTICHTAGGTTTATHGSSNRVAATQASVKVTFSAQAGASAVWTPGTITCSTTACHGTGAVVWGATSAAPVNGFPYSAVQCDKCHSGTATAPFYSTAIPKVTANTDAKVGAHTSHLTAPDGLATAFVCAGCHGTVALNSATHMNGTTNFSWSALAQTGGLVPAYNGATGTCTNVYCHGGAMPGGDTTGTNRAPVWNSTTYLPATISATACGTCHGFPPAAASGHPSGITIPANFGNGTVAIGTTCSCHPNINTTGTTYANIFVDKTLHINGVLETPAGGTCIGCHASIQTGTHGTPRDAVMAEFGLAWGHKKTGRGAVTDADCIVCHLEGDFTTQKPSAKHQDGNIDLRDPDGVGEAAITNISGTAFTFTKFATSYAAASRTTTGQTSNTDIANVISLKFCLACHDSNGATNTTARSNNGGTGTAAMPWGGKALGATYTAANNAVGTQGLIDVKTQTLTTNASAHPIQGPRNRAYPTPNRFNAPYNNFTRTGGTKANGVVINCFDCHNTPTPLTTRTIVSHGNAVTLRGNIWTNPDSLCTACHIPNLTATNGQHGVGSAFASSTNSGMQSYINGRCEYCHSSSTASPGRPIRAQDVHGFDRFAGSGTDVMWPVGAGDTYKPYAFFRNVTNWTTNSWKPLSGPGVPAGTANCGGSGKVSSGCTGETMSNYTPGGVY